MGVLARIPFELQSVTTGVEFETVLGSPTIDNTSKMGSVGSLRVSGSLGAGTNHGISHTFGSNVGTVFLRWAFYIHSLDTGVQVRLRNMSGASAGLDIIITNVAGTLTTLINYNNGGNTLVNTASLAFDRKHVFTAKYDSSPAGANDIIVVYLDGVQVASTIVASLSSASSVISVDVNNPTIGTVTGTDVYFDDLAVNGTAGSSENDLPTWNAVMARGILSAVGDNNQWQAQASSTQGTSVVSNLTETIPDDATTYNKRTTNSPATQPIDDFTLTSPASYGIGVNDTIKFIMVGGRVGATSNTATARDGRFRIKSASGGSVVDSGSVDWSFNGWRTNVDTGIPTYQLISYTDPTTGTTWTVTGTNSLTNAQIGYQANTSSTNEIRVSTLFAIIEYVPSTTAFIAHPNIIPRQAVNRASTY